MYLVCASVLGAGDTGWTSQATSTLTELTFRSGWQARDKQVNIQYDVRWLVSDRQKTKQSKKLESDEGVPFWKGWPEQIFKKNPEWSKRRYCDWELPSAKNKQQVQRPWDGSMHGVPDELYKKATCRFFQQMPWDAWLAYSVEHATLDLRKMEAVIITATTSANIYCGFTMCLALCQGPNVD